MKNKYEDEKRSYNYYSQDGGKKYHDDVHGGLDAYGIALINKRRTRKISPQLKNVENLLEYGVGLGWNISSLPVVNKVGYDVASTLQSQVESSGIDFKTSLDESDFESYDFILCSHVLEHMPHPIDGLREIKKCLTEDGLALIYLPLEKDYFARSFKENDQYQHVYTWSLQNFYNLAKTVGFEVVSGKRRKFGYERILGIFVQRFKGPFWLYQFLLWCALLIRPDYEIEVVLKKIDADT